MQDILGQLSNYLIMLSGCIFGSGIGLEKVTNKEITMVRYVGGVFIPISIGLCFEIMHTNCVAIIFDLSDTIIMLLKQQPK